jgi:hypothetical protein
MKAQVNGPERDRQVWNREMAAATEKTDRPPGKINFQELSYRNIPGTQRRTEIDFRIVRELTPVRRRPTGDRTSAI